MILDNDIRTTTIIGIASCCGARDRRCAAGPSVIRRLAQERQWLHPGNRLRWPTMLSAPPSDDGATPLERAAKIATETAQQVEEVLLRNDFVALFSGDHSSAIGSWSGVANAYHSQGPIGLIWIDAHMDSHTPATSPSGALHGMPVATLLGHGPELLLNIARPGAKIAPQNIVLIGVRSYEPAEEQFLQRLGVNYFPMAQVQQLGLEQVMQMARDQVTHNSVAYGLSIDLDAIDPQDAPGVGSPVVGGIPAQALIAALQPFQKDRRLVALEVAEFNPMIEASQRTADVALALLQAVHGRITSQTKSINRPQSNAGDERDEQHHR